MNSEGTEEVKREVTWSHSTSSRAWFWALAVGPQSLQSQINHYNSTGELESVTAFEKPCACW